MKVCIVGCGPSGLTTIKQLRDEGHEVVCFDRNADLGGIWQRDDDDGTQAKAFDDLYLTISMKMMAYSDHPYVAKDPAHRIFYTRRQYFDYLMEYADRYGLQQYIRSGTEVTDVKRTADGWRVFGTRRDDADAEFVEDFDAIAVCSGPFRKPKDDLAELAGFTGEIVHSAHYRNAERFTGKRVLIVGLAESGADIVRQVGDVASACTLSIRSYTWLLPRVYNATQTTDNGTVRSHHHEMLRRATDKPFVLQSFWGRNSVAKVLFAALTMIYGIGTTAVGAVERRILRRIPPTPATNPFGEPTLPEKLDLQTVHTDENWEMVRTWNRRSHPDGSWTQRGIFCKNVTFIPSLVDGRVTLNDAGIDRAEGNRVFFKDGTDAEFDSIVLCTGYHRDSIQLGDLTVAEANVRNLYKHFLHPDHNGTAAFIGFIRPFSGGVPICAEMQARYFARVLSGKLNPPANLHKVIADERDWEEYWTELSPRSTEAIPSQVLYLDALAQEIGCQVPMWKMATNPKLFSQLWFGSFNQSCYRIVGPHNLGDAALADLYSEPIENRGVTALRYPLMQLLPSSKHPKYLM